MAARAGNGNGNGMKCEELRHSTNHLGLYAEQTGASGQAVGDFPQAFPHLALISAAFNLDRALGARRD